MARKPPTKGNPLTRKIGPAPAYAWVLAAVIGFLVYRHYRANQNAAATAANQNAATFPDTGTTGGQLDATGGPMYGGGTPASGGNMGLPGNVLSNPPTPSGDPTSTSPPLNQPPNGPTTFFPPHNQPPVVPPAPTIHIPPANQKGKTNTGTGTGALR